MYIVYVYIQKCIYKGKRCACEYGYITYNVKEKQEKTCTFVSLHQYSLYLVAEFSITYVYFGLHTRTPECSIRPSECFGSVAKKKKIILYFLPPIALIAYFIFYLYAFHRVLQCPSLLF